MRIVSNILLQLKDDTAAPHINIRSRNIKHPRKLKKIFIFLIVLALCITYFLGKYFLFYFFPYSYLDLCVFGCVIELLWICKTTYVRNYFCCFKFYKTNYNNEIPTISINRQSIKHWIPQGGTFSVKISLYKSRMTISWLNKNI